jgi:glycerophosphoryl diester phosphodiesterase
VISRRTVLLAAAGAVAAGVGVPVALAAARPRDRVAALGARHPFVVAHRGGDDDWPEMSLLAYRSALALGVDAVEVSLARTSDGVWFGLHDGTLDRTSGVRGFVAAEHTWAQVSALRISARTTRDPGTPAQPYARLEDVVAAVGGRRPIFVDPKSAQGHADELLDLLARLVDHPQDLVVAKGQIGLQQLWATRARAKGFRTWGFTYGESLGTNPALLTTDLPVWSWVGLDVGAGAKAWAAVRALGRPIIAHQVSTVDQRRTAVDLGADGLMVSDVRAVLAPSDASTRTTG